MRDQPYSNAFFEHISRTARRSAREIVPLVLELVRPTSVIDVGCGLGTWLAEFQAHGVSDVWGVDGDYVHARDLEIPVERFLARDLTRPLRLDRRFDLVLSMEVAEHLPAEYADAFVASLASLGPVILFSAAIPRQDGTHHVNGQWPEYWAARFKVRGFEVIDCLRKQIWNNENVEWWYAQNSFIYANSQAIETLLPLKKALAMTNSAQLSMVHPKLYGHRMMLGDFSNLPVRKVVPALPYMFMNALRRRWARHKSRTST